MTANSGYDQVIRPAAIISDKAARVITDWLRLQDVRQGGRWRTTVSTWERFDFPWNGPAGQPGTSLPVGSVHVVYDQPRRYWATIFRVMVTPHGAALGYTVNGIADEALQQGELTLESCPRDDTMAQSRRDPFKDRPADL